MCRSDKARVAIRPEAKAGVILQSIREMTRLNDDKTKATYAILAIVYCTLTRPTDFSKEFKKKLISDSKNKMKMGWLTLR